MRRETWLVIGMLVLVFALAGSLIYTVAIMHGQRGADGTPQLTDSTSFEGTVPAEAANGPTGERLYERTCMACHGRDGQGRPGAFPPLAGHLPRFMHTDGGRDYLIDVLLYGLSGPIDIDGTRYEGFMAPVNRLDDDEIARVLNYSLQAWNNHEQLPAGFQALTADEVEARRGRPIGPGDVHDERPELPSAE